MSRQFSRSIITLALSCSIGFSALSSLNVFAEDAKAPGTADSVTPEVANSKYHFTGTVNANAVYVRSGPGENYYPTLKLDKGAEVTVVGIKFDWLKILPPKGSFSYVAKAYVEKRGDGSVGRVTKPDLNVRAGSDLNPMKTTVQMKLGAEVDVKILGEQDEYFKIVPPEGSFVYVNKQYIDPGTPLVANALPAKTDQEPIASAPVLPVIKSSEQAVAPSTQPAKPEVALTGNEAGAPAAPATQPVAVKIPVDQQFDKIEAQFASASTKNIGEQPLSELKSSYETALADEALPVSMRRLGEMRLATIKVRLDSQQQFLAAKKDLDESTARLKAAGEEAKELTARIEASKVTVYAALGTLRTSSLQQGVGTLYRLCDPTSGRTLVYVRSLDPKISTMLNQFVGLKGDIVVDTQMNIKSIAPTSMDVVELSKVNNGVTATILPPSLLPQVSTTKN